MMMDSKQITRQMLQLNKVAFDNTLNSMIAIQEQLEKMIEMYLKQLPMMPAEGKKVIEDWMNAYKRGRADFKVAVEENYRKVDEFFLPRDTEGKKS
jgi:polyhydroxyalkanoate synthesis regulator phasin